MMKTTLALPVLVIALLAGCSSSAPKQDPTEGSALDLKPQSTTQANSMRSECAQVAADIESLLAERSRFSGGTSATHDPLADMRLQSLEAKGDSMGCDTSRYMRDRMSSGFEPTDLPRAH
jgi:uncharacterized protein YceK